MAGELNFFLIGVKGTCLNHYNYSMHYWSIVAPGDRTNTGTNTNANFNTDNANLTTDDTNANPNNLSELDKLFELYFRSPTEHLVDPNTNVPSNSSDFE